LTPPAPFRGWRIVGALALAQGCGLGLLNAYGLVVEPLAAEFGASVAVIGAGMSIFVLSLAVTSAFLGPLLDRGLVRPTMLAGVVAMLVGMTWLAHAPTLGQLGLGLAVASVGVAAYGPLPANVVLVNWFDARRGTALAIAAAGPAVVGFFVPGATTWLIELGGWRTALQTLSLGLGALALPVIAWVVVARPGDVGQTVDGRAPGAAPQGQASATDAESAGDLLRARDFWLLALGFGLYFAVPVGMGLFIVPLLLELGFSPWMAATGATLAAASNLLGTIAAGALADRFRPKRVLIGFLSVFIAALVVMGTAGSAVVVFAAVVPLAASFGGGQPLMPLLVGGRFGPAIVGRALGIMGPIGLPFLIASAPLAGLLRDASGTYRSVFLGGAAAVAVAATLLQIVPARRPD